MKANLRDEIINSATTEDKQMYIRDFLRLNLYDYVDSLKNNLGSSPEKLKTYINDYAEKTVDREYLRTLLKSFDTDRLKQINDILESVN